MSKPGVMLYFDIRPCLKRFECEEKGLLFDAILDYAEFGNEPDFEGALGVAWDFIKPSIDRDSERYGNQVLQKKYAAYVRESRKKTLSTLPFEEWKSASANERNRLTSDDIGWHPAPTTKTASAPTTKTASAPAPNDVKAAKPPTRHRYGSYKNVLFSEAEYEKLQEEFPNDYASRIERLGEYIASTGKSYKNHLATIRSWARKDGTKAGAMPSYGGDENWSL